MNLREYVNLSVLVNNRDRNMDNIDVTYKYIIILKQSIDMIWGIDVCIAYKILLIPYLRQVLISSGTDICVCMVRNLKGEWEGEIKDVRSPNRLLFEELKRQILAPIKAIDNTKLNEEEFFRKLLGKVKISDLT